MNPVFDTPEQVDQHFQGLINQAPDKLRASELRAEAAEAKVALQVRANDVKMINAYRKAALADFPEAARFPQLVTGETEEEIYRTAEAAHKQVMELRGGVQGTDSWQQARQNAREIYGPGSIAGSTAPAGPSFPTMGSQPNMAELRRERELGQQINDAPRDSYGQKIVNKAITDEYTTQRFVDHVKKAIGFWGAMTNSSYAARRQG